MSMIPCEALREWAARQPTVRAVYVFGSYATGTATAQSDLDLAFDFIDALDAKESLSELIDNAARWKAELSALTGIVVKDLYLSTAPVTQGPRKLVSAENDRSARPGPNSGHLAPRSVTLQRALKRHRLLSQKQIGDQLAREQQRHAETIGLHLYDTAGRSHHHHERGCHYDRVDHLVLPVEMAVPLRAASGAYISPAVPMTTFAFPTFASDGAGLSLRFRCDRVVSLTSVLPR